MQIKIKKSIERLKKKNVTLIRGFVSTHVSSIQ